MIDYNPASDLTVCLQSSGLGSMAWPHACDLTASWSDAWLLHAAEAFSALQQLPACRTYMLLKNASTSC